MSEQSETFKLMDNLWKVTPNDVPQQADKRKLAKPEERPREKTQQRRQRPQILATASQAMNRRDAKAEVWDWETIRIIMQ